MEVPDWIGGRIENTDIAFIDACHRVGEFEQYLIESGVRVHVGSELGRAISLARTAIERPEEPPEFLRSAHDIADLQRLVYVAALASAVVGRRDRCLRESLPVQRLRDFAKSVPQPQPAGASSTSRNLSFEVLAACALTHVGRDVTLEEPDVTARVRGRRLAVACKVIYGDEHAAASRTDEGIDQIRRVGGAVDEGIVLVNVSNQLDIEGATPARFGMLPLFRSPGEMHRAVAATRLPLVLRIRERCHRRAPADCHPAFGIVFIAWFLAMVGSRVTLGCVTAGAEIGDPPAAQKQILDAFSTALMMRS